MRLSLFFIGVMWLGTAWAADVSGMFLDQGRLMTPDGRVAQGIVSMVMRVYASGAQVCEERHSVAVHDGFFNIDLGSGVCPGVMRRVAKGEDVSLEVAVNGEALSCFPLTLRKKKAKHPNWSWIKGGSFQMGSVGDDDEPPVDTVASFYMSRTEVTVAEYRVCVSTGDCEEPFVVDKGCNWGVKGRDKLPINCVSWDEAQAYARFAGARLPTEAEWEYAMQRKGPESLTTVGDVCEWVVARCAKEGTRRDDDAVSCGSGFRVCRGGGSGKAGRSSRAARRKKMRSLRSAHIGFRLARTCP